MGRSDQTNNIWKGKESTQVRSRGRNVQTHVDHLITLMPSRPTGAIVLYSSLQTASEVATPTYLIIVCPSLFV